MLPRHFSARFVLLFSLAILSVVSVPFHSAAAASQTGLLAYCVSGLEQSPVYVTQIFNTGLNPNYIADTSPIQNEYNEYLKGRFSTKSNSSFPVACWVSLNM